MTDHFTEFAFPDTDLARRAYAHAYEEVSEALAHHSVRSYLFGRAAGEGMGLKAGSDYDDELLFLACLLHDLGLTERADHDQRFEVDGADAAAAFLDGQGVPADRVRVVWEAVALHTSVGIAHRMRPEIALTHTGAGIDVVALGAENLPEGLADRVHAAFPRLELGDDLSGTIVAQAAANPLKAPVGTFPSELLRQFHPEIPMPRWEDMTRDAWPGVA
ncbi:HD domain-containing protein [Actinomadura kijaniata]|uniref:HD domain-containing protein n=1 Tax=Actinomadura kijaniata TaxID=46161 RepID=UPI003F1E2CE6